MPPEETGMIDERSGFGAADGPGAAAGNEQDFRAQAAPPLATPWTGGRGGNLLLAGLFAAGIGCVYLLSLRKGPAEAGAEQRASEIQVETVLASLGEGPSGDIPAPKSKAGALVEAFYLQTRQRQIPIEKLWGNPFVYKSPVVFDPVKPKAAKPAPPGKAKTKPGSPLAEARKLLLQSVLTGSQGRTAMISNNLLSEGQTIRGWTVSRIQSNQVILTLRDQKYVLEMP